MKLGKKVLSCVLAVMIIVTTISVCFNSFAADAESQLKSLYNQINLDYDGLMDAINSGDPDRVPTQENSGSVWVVAQDTYHSGWYNVAKTFSSYSKAVTTASGNNGINSYKDVIDSALTGLRELETKGDLTGASIDDVEKVLDYFKFGVEGDITGTGLGRTLKIEAGIDYFAWETIEEIETDRNYFNATLRYNNIVNKGGTVFGLTPDSINFETDSAKNAEVTETIRTSLEAIKSALLMTVDEDAFLKWFNLDFSTMTADEIRALVEGENSAAGVLGAFSLAASLAGFDDEGAALWDHYVAEKVGKTFEETKEWIDSGLMESIYKAYAATYKDLFDEKMAVDLSQLSGAEVLNLYNEVVEIDRQLHAQKSYDNVTDIFDFILPYLNGDDSYYSSTVTDYIVALKKEVAKTYAKELADELADLLAEEVPTYDHSDPEAADAWEGSEGQEAARDFLRRAIEMKEKINTFILGYGTFDDVAASFSENNNRVTENGYNNLLKKIDTASIDADGADEFANKATMDSIMASTIFGGMTYFDITTLAAEFRRLYNKALALKNTESKKALYDAVYPDGIDAYAEYMNLIKYRAIARIYEQISRVEKYYTKDKKVTFYNFEAILSAYDALEVNYTSLNTFLDEDPAYDRDKLPKEIPNSERYTINDVYSQFTKADTYQREANDFKTNLNALINAANGDDIRIQSNLLNNFNNSWSWRSSVGKLNVDDLVRLVNEIGLKNQTVTLDSLPGLMTEAVKDFDKILVSNDLGTILNSFIPSDDEDGFLGKWEYDYTETTGVVHKAGEDVKNLREFLVNTIVKLLYGGDLLNLIMNKLYPLLGSLFAENLGKVGNLNELPVGGIMPNVDASIVGYIYFEGLGHVLSYLIPTMPEHFIWGTGTTYSQYGNIGVDSSVQYSNLFSGKLNSNMYYPDVLRAIGHAQIFEGKDLSYGQWTNGSIASSSFWDGASGFSTSYWNPIEVQQRKSAVSSSWPLNDRNYFVYGHSITENNSVDWTKMGIYPDDTPEDQRTVDPHNVWKLDANRKETLYYALAAALGGLGSVLRVLLTGQSQTVTANLTVLLGIVNDPNVTATFNGDNLYTRLVEPLYQILGIPRSQYHSLAEIQSAATVSKNGNVYLLSNNGGATLFQYLLEPILNWMETDLFQRPVETLFGILPNLLAAIEHNQILPKLKNLTLKISALANIINLELDIWELALKGSGILSSVNVHFIEGLENIGQLLKDQLGVPLDGGIQGLVNGLLGFKATTSRPTDDMKPLMAVNADGTASTTSYATYSVGTTTYYFINSGLAAQALYNLMGDDYIEWMFTSKSGGKTTNNIGNGKTANFPLSIPVNRFLAAGDQTYWDGMDGNRHYKVNVNPGTVILEVFRWIMDDGAWYVLKGLIAPLLAPAGGEGEEGAEGGTDIIGMISKIIDGQADNIMMVLICLLNEYNIDFTEFYDPVANNKFTDLDGNSLLGSGNSTSFVLGEILEEMLSESGDPENPYTTYEQKMDKADLAVDNIDKIIISLLPMIFTLVGGLLGDNETVAPYFEKLGIDDIAARTATGELTSLTQIFGEILSGGLIDLLVELLFGTHETTTSKNEDGEDVTTVDKGLLGGLLDGGSDIITSVFDLLAQLELDISPLGFYNNAASTGAGKNDGVKNWLEYQAQLFDSNLSTTEALDKMTWADVSAETPKNHKWFTNAGFDTYENTKATYENFFGFIESLLTPLNPILALLLTGEDITFLDELTIRGNEGYSRAIVPILEAFGLDDACMSQADFNRIVYGTGSSALNSDGSVKDKSAGSDRFYAEDVSPLDPLFNAIALLLVGDGNTPGFLDAPISTLAERIPNIAYLFYRFVDPNGDGTATTSNIVIAIENLIAPVLKILEIADPVLSRLVNLDIRGLLEQYLDIETLLNDLLSGLIGEGENYAFNQILDFGKIAANSASKIDKDASTNRYSENNTKTFTKFEGRKGQFLITIVREILSSSMVRFIIGLIEDLLDSEYITNEENYEFARDYILPILYQAEKNLTGKTNDAAHVDQLTGLLIDLLTDYNPGQKVDYFYNKINNDELSDNDVENYLIEHYDYFSDHDDLDEAQINEAISNIDFVVSEAIGDVLGALIEEEVLDLSSLIGKDFDFSEADSVWKFVETLVNTALFSDDIIDMIGNLILGLIGNVGMDTGTVDMILSVVRAAGFDVSTSAYLIKDGQINKASPLYSYLTYGTDDLKIKGSVVYATVDGKEVELSWTQIYLNHTKEVDSVDENGEPIKTREFVENDGKWSWGLDNITGTTDEIFTEGKAKFVDIIYAVVAPLADIVTALLAGDNLEVFNGGLSIRGSNAYENVALPILNALGLDTIFEYAGLEDAEGNPIKIMSAEEYTELVKTEEGVKEAMATFVDYLFYFLQAFLGHPISSLGVAIPTFAYFVYGDGLSTLVQNLLVPITTLLDKIDHIAKINYEVFLATLIDAISELEFFGGSGNLDFTAFVEAILEMLEAADPEYDGEFNQTHRNFTEELFNLLSNLEIDLSSILAPSDVELTDEEKENYKFSIIYFIEHDKELEAKAAIKEGDTDKAIEIRTKAFFDLFKSIAALGSTEGNGLVRNKKYVNINNNGQVKVSNASVLMYIIEFLVNNTALLEVLDNLDMAVVEVEGVITLDPKELIDNVLQNPSKLVQVIIDLLTYYEVGEPNPVELIEIDSETHEDFYEDLGYNSLDDVLADLEDDPSLDINELSRVHTYAAIDNLDALVGTILNLFKDQLVGAGGFLADLGFDAEDDLTLKGIVDGLLENYVYQDEGFNSLVSMLIGALGNEENKQLINIILTVVEGAGYSLTPQTIATHVPQLAGVIGDAKKWNVVAKNNSQYKYVDEDGNTVYDAESGRTEIDGKTVKAVMVQTTDEEGNVIDTDVQAKDVVITNVEWKITNRDELIEVVWNLIKPLAPIFETLLTGGSITIYEKINIRGMKGYEGVILPLAEALNITKLVDNEGNKYLPDDYKLSYEEFEKAVYDFDSGNNRTLKDGKLLLKALTDIIFALVDSICERPVSTILTIIPSLARFIQSNGIDVVLENLIAPITAILDKLSFIIELDVIGIVKNLLISLIEDMNEAEGVDVDGYDVEDQELATAALVAYVLDIIEENESGNRSIFANILSDELRTIDEPAALENKIYFLDILWRLVDSIDINGTSLAGIVPDTIFADLASCVWLAPAENESNSMPKVEIGEDGRSGHIAEYVDVEETTVDRETVLIKLLNWIVFTPGIRAIIGEVAGIDYSSLATATNDNKDLVTTLVYSVFDNAQAVEKLIIALLSWYDITYKPVRVKDDYSEFKGIAIDYEKINIDEELLNKLPSDIDGLLTKVLPAVIALLPEGTLGSLKLEGANLEEIVKNLVVSLLAGEEGEEGLITSLVAMLVNLLGGNEIVGMVLSMLPEVIPGLELSLKYFKESSEAFADYFDGCDTWADAYNKFKVEVKAADEEEGTAAEYEVVLKDANNFGVNSYDALLDLVASVLAPLVPVLKVIFSEEDLVALDGIHITAGDGYDRFLVPLLEVLGVENIMDAKDFNKLDNKEYAAKVVDYIDAILNLVLTSPVQFIVDLIPQLVFFVYSDGLRQSIEQLIAPITTLVDLVNDVLAKRFKYPNNDTELYAIDIYEFITDLINNNETMMDLLDGEKVEDLYDLVDALLSAEGLEAILVKLITGEGVDLEELGFADGILKTVLEKSCTIGDVETVRYFGAKESGFKRTVKGVSSSRADTLIGIVSDFLLAGDLLETILEMAGVELDDTIKGVLDAVTGDNRYVLFQILIKYFNEYEVESMLLEYLSFDKIDALYDEYLDGSVLTQRKLRRAIKKLDASINSTIPGLLPILENLLGDNETFANIINTIDTEKVQNLKDVVDQILMSLAFKDEMIGDLVGMLVGLLGGEDLADTLSTVLPIVDQLLGINLTPQAFAEGESALGENISAAIAAAEANFVPEVDEEGNETEFVATWADVATYFEANAETLTWGVDAANGFEAKKDAFVAILADLVVPLEGVLNLILRGDSIGILPDEETGDPAIAIYGNDGYGTALYELFRILLNAEDFAQVVTPKEYAAAKGTEVTLTAITDAIFMFVDELCAGPIEYILTVLPKLSYALASNGVEVIVSNLIAPVLAIYNLAEPVVGDLLEDLIGGAIGNTLKDFMPEGAGIEKTREVTDEETGETTEETYWVYSINEILGIAGEDGSNIIGIINHLLTSLTVTDEDGMERPVGIELKKSFFMDYAQHTITVAKAKSNSKWYYYLANGDKVDSDDYDYTSMGSIVDLKYVVDGFDVDIADSLIFLLDTVLSEDIIYAIAHLIDVDVDDSDNMIAVVLKAIAKGDMSAYVLADIISKIFNGYEVTYPVYHDKLIETNHEAYDTLSDEQKEKVDDLPRKLDTVLNQAIPALLPLILDLLAPQADEEGNVADPSDIYNLLKDYVDEADEVSIRGLIDKLLSDFALKDSTVDSLVSLLVGLLGGEDVSEILTMITPLINNVAGLDVNPQTFAKGSSKLKEYIGDAKTWADVLAQHSTDGEEFDWGIDAVEGTDAKIKVFIEVLGDILQPIFPILQFALQGKTLSLFNAGAPEYKPADPTDPDDKRADNASGNGYANITGLSAYEQVLLVLVDALPGTFKDVDLMSVEDFNKIDNATDMLEYIVNDILFTIVDDLAQSPITFISENIATLVYFLANDGIYRIVNSALSIVNVLLEGTAELFDDGKALTIQELIPQLAIIKLSDTGSYKGLLSTINELLANANLGIVLTQDMLLEFAGMMGDYATVDSLRTATDGALINEKDRLVNVDGKVLTDAELEAGQGTITTIIGSGKYVITGLLGFVLSDEMLGNILGEQEVADLVQTLIDNLTAPDGVSNVVNVLIKLFYKYVINYKQYVQPELDKIDASPSGNEKLAELADVLGGIDSLIPMILSFIDDSASSLKDLIYPLFVTDDIANLLVGMLVPLLAGLPSDTIDMVISFVNDLTNLKKISLAPQAFAEAPFNSKLGDYIGDAKTWAEVWEAHSEENADGERVAVDYKWGIETPTDFINLISDLLLPLDEVLGLLLTGGTISAFEEINIIGGDGYNYALIPLLELLGVEDLLTAEEFKAKAADEGSIHYILTVLFDRLDEILEAPVANILSIFANLAYIIGNNSIETFVYNLLAPVNELISVIDPILPIAINIDLAELAAGGEVAKIFLGQEHPGVEAGITVKASGIVIANLINSMLAGINIGTEEEPKMLGIKLDLDWLKIAATAAAEGENGKIKFKGSSFTGSYEYKNVVGDPASTLIAILKIVLTKENIDAILEALGQEGGLQPPLDSIVDQVIEDPATILDLIKSLLGSKEISYVPIQNRLVTPRKYDYSMHTILTKTNADLIVANLDTAIVDILELAGQGTLRDLVTPLFATSDMINTILDALVGALGSDTVNNILEGLAGFSRENDLGIDLDLTVGTFYNVLSQLKDYNGQGSVNIKAGVDKLNVNSWADVGSFAGTNWGFKDGDINGFVKVLGDFLTPLNSVLEFLLIGEGRELNLFDLITLAGGNGYDYAIIPLIEAFGFTDVLTLEEYKALVADDPSQLLGYVLEKVAQLADKLLDKPVDTLLGLLPNLAYFLSNDGLYLVVRNLAAPLYSIVEVVLQLFGVNIEEFLDLAELLHSIAIGDMIGEILGEKYDLRIPKFDWLDIATWCGSEAIEVKTARSEKANSFERKVNPHPYIEEYNTKDSKYKDEIQYPHKETQTYVVSDKSATLTYLLTWLLDMFGDQHNRNALTNWLAGVFDLDNATKAQVGYVLDKMFDATKAFGLSELIVGVLFQVLGIAIFIEPIIVSDTQRVAAILYDFFGYLGVNIECPYSSVAKVMEELTGIWLKNIGTDDEFEDAGEQVEETLNWFQRFIKAIRDFFRRLFGLD